MVQDFEVEKDLAKFIVRVSTEADNRQKLIDENSLNLWYLNSKVPNTSPIFHTPFSISFTSLKKEMAATLFLMFGNYVFTGDIEATGQQFVLEFLVALWQSITKIEKTQLCVYYRIIDVLKTSNIDHFSLEDVIPYDENQGVYECNRKPKIWECPYWCNNVCKLRKGDIQDILNVLVDKGVLSKNGDIWSIIK